MKRQKRVQLKGAHHSASRHRPLWRQPGDPGARRPGTGVKAGPGVRECWSAAGVHNILTKTHGSTNPINLVKATIQGLLQLRTREEVAQLGE